MKKKRSTSKPQNIDEALLWAKKQYPEWADDIVLCPKEQSKVDDEEYRKEVEELARIRQERIDRGEDVEGEERAEIEAANRSCLITCAFVMIILGAILLYTCSP